MIPAVRSWFNKSFTVEKYENYLRDLNGPHPGELEFRIAETPVFCDKIFAEKMLSTCETIVDLVVSPEFKTISLPAIPSNLVVPGDDLQPEFIAFDFGVCENEQGQLEPQLVEMQGFPTMFAFQAWQEEVARKIFQIPDNFDSYLNGFNRDRYVGVLKEIILNGHQPENVILLEIFPEKQKTRIDFLYTEDFTGIRQVCLTKIIRKGRKLFYIRDGIETGVKRIYNRVIFDDLLQQAAEVQETGKWMLEDLDVEWAPHPNWFYRISKHTLPFIKDKYVPETKFLSEISETPEDLENYVLKPLFSFAGQGVIIDVTKQDLDQVKDRENWILQRKVRYAEVIETPDGRAKAEIRVFYFWKKGDPRPVATNNLARISKGKMIGVRYNKDKTWVGGTLAYFEK